MRKDNLKDGPKGEDGSVLMVAVDAEMWDYIKERAAYNKARGKGPTEPEDVLVEEARYAKNRRAALAKDGAKPKEARRCKHAEPGALCPVCGREGKA